MAFASKGAQRLAGSRDYAASESTLDSSSVEDTDMGNSGPVKVWGKVDSGKPAKIFGRTQTKSADAKLTGKIKGK